MRETRLQRLWCAEPLPSLPFARHQLDFPAKRLQSDYVRVRGFDQAPDGLLGQ
jgi:hypothetical protein